MKTDFCEDGGGNILAINPEQGAEVVTVAATSHHHRTSGRRLISLQSSPVVCQLRASKEGYPLVLTEDFTITRLGPSPGQKWPLAQSS